jgi:hypothetical protein
VVLRLHVFHHVHDGELEVQDVARDRREPPAKQRARVGCEERGSRGAVVGAKDEVATNQDLHTSK